MILRNYNKLYFIGIGGSSMSGLACLLQSRGYIVAGSDMQESYTSKMLTDRGISVFFGHHSENIERFLPEAIVKTDAIADNNPELIKALELNIPVFRRAELLGAILDGFEKTVGVAGTHGKTTTTSMITAINIACNVDPSALIGGKMLDIGSSWKEGTGKTCIFESCEFRESYLFFKSNVSVILNIACDHMEYFKTEDNLINSFAQYTQNVRSGGSLIINAEDENSLKMLQKSGYNGKILTFGLNKGDITASNIKTEHGLYSFSVNKNNDKLFDVNLRVPGEHNVKNALAATAAAIADGLPIDGIKKGLESFGGVARRFEYHCTINGAVIADDYGHHPDAYRVVFKTARELGFKRIIAIHQPHTFSRTKMLMNEFCEVLSTVDKVLVTPIFAARETNDAYNISAQDIINKLPNAEFVKDFRAIADRIKELAQPGDLFITLGCGDINKAAILTTDLYGEKKY